jgi:hypothetical protein
MPRSKRPYNFLGKDFSVGKAHTIAVRARTVAVQQARVVDRLLEITGVAVEDAGPRQAPYLGKLDREHIQLLGETVLRITLKPPNKARAGLHTLAGQLERGRGRYARHTEFLAELAVSLRAYAACLPYGDVGNPNEPQTLSTRRVSEILDELNSLAKSMNYEGWDKELAEPGSAGVPSRGRNLVAKIFEGRFGADPKGRTAAELVRFRLSTDSRAQRRAEDRFIKYWTNWLRCE